MGYMTVVTILNDGWHVIKKNKDELIDRIEDGMKGIERSCGSPHLSKKRVTKHSIKNYSSVVSVNRSFHADDENLLYVGMNNMKNLSHADPDLSIDHIKTRIKDLNHASELLNRSKEYMYIRMAEYILKECRQKGKTDEEISNGIDAYVNELVCENGKSVSEKELRKAIKSLT